MSPRPAVRTRLRALLWGLCGVLALQLGVSLVQACSSAEEPRLMPAAGGSLKDLGIQFSRVDGERFLVVYGQLFASLDADTVVHVIVGDADDERIFEEARLSWSSPIEVRYVRADRPITSWMRDRLAVLEGPAFIAPMAPMTGAEARANDWRVPWVLADSGSLGLDVPVRRAAFQFEGGDLIGDDSHVFVAPPLLERNPELSAAEVLDRVALESGMEPVLVGGRAPVPDHHIGMFLTPLGGGRVAVADAELGLRAVGDVDGVWAGETWVELDRRPERLERFRQLARDVEAAGFEVVPLPILPAKERYVMFSANNVLLERRDGAPHVYLPAYDNAAFDRAATRAWRDLGATVHPIDVSGVFRLGGSVRCLTAPLVRQ